MTEKDKTTVVLAMHRSGSSAVAGILHYLGVDMGAKHFMPPSARNPKGYFEDKRFVALNERILASVGGAWNVNVSRDWIDYARDKFDDDVRDLVSGRTGIWGWKDPRTVMTFPLYAPHLHNVLFIVVGRTGTAIANSLQARNKIPLEQGLEFATTYYQRIEELTEKFMYPAWPAWWVSYEQLVKNPEKVISLIASVVGLHGSVPIDFIDADLKHF